MSVQQVPSVREFLFHPLSEKHSTTTKTLAVITTIALTILTGGLFLAVFIGINFYDRRSTEVQQKPEELAGRVKLTNGQFDDLATHNTAKNCWIAISGRVYDITKFIDEHPGGDDVLLDHAGKDATRAFEDIGHTPDAISQMERYLIGNLT